MGWQLLQSTAVSQVQAHVLKLRQPCECVPKHHRLRGGPTQVQRSQLWPVLEHQQGGVRHSHLRTAEVEKELKPGQPDQAAQAWANINAMNAQDFQHGHLGSGNIAWAAIGSNDMVRWDSEGMGGMSGH